MPRPRVGASSNPSSRRDRHVPYKIGTASPRPPRSARAETHLHAINDKCFRDRDIRGTPRPPCRCAAATGAVAPPRTPSPNFEPDSALYPLHLPPRHRRRWREGSGPHMHTPRRTGFHALPPIGRFRTARPRRPGAARARERPDSHGTRRRWPCLVIDATTEEGGTAADEEAWRGRGGIAAARATGDGCGGVESGEREGWAGGRADPAAAPDPHETGERYTLSRRRGSPSTSASITSFSAPYPGTYE
jgi:hypothetical protein